MIKLKCARAVIGLGIIYALSVFLAFGCREKRQSNLKYKFISIAAPAGSYIKTFPDWLPNDPWADFCVIMPLRNREIYIHISSMTSKSRMTGGQSIEVVAKMLEGALKQEGKVISERKVTVTKRKMKGKLWSEKIGERIVTHVIAWDKEILFKAMWACTESEQKMVENKVVRLLKKVDFEIDFSSK